MNIEIATASMATDRRPEYFKGARLRVGISGCEYVGLPLGLRFAEAGHRVIGFDTDSAKVGKLNRGETYIEHIPQNKIQQFVQAKSVPIDPKMLAGYDCVLIATDHTSYDYPAIVESSQLVVDTRNATRHIVRHRDKLVLV